MFKRKNSKWLVIVFVVLLAVVLIQQQYQAKKGERSFRKELVSVDTADVTAVKIFPPEDKNPDFEIYRKNGNWRIRSEKIDSKADPKAVDAILKQLTEMKPERLAARSKEQWEKYEVMDTASLRVVIEEDGKNVGEVIVGKFSFNPRKQPQNQQGMSAYQPRGKMTSFVRMAGEQEVYALDGYLKTVFRPQLKSFRNKNLVAVNKKDLKKVEFNYPAQSFTLQKKNNQWTVNGMTVDSAQTASYIQQLANRRSNSYVDDWPESKLNDPQYTITAHGDNFSPITLKAYKADSTHQFIVTSTENDAMFSGRKGNLFKNTFMKMDYFLGAGKK